MTDYAHLQAPNSFADRMDNPDTSVKSPPRPEASKTTLPQPGRPIPSRAYPGALIVVEGTDGSGKSTQLYLLKRWLEIGGYRLHFTEWNSSPLVKSATRRGKQKRLLTPTTFSLLHAADFADRCERQIMPLLQGDYLVLADRYVYTAFARDAARGCSHRWLRNLPAGWGGDDRFCFADQLHRQRQYLLECRRSGRHFSPGDGGRRHLVGAEQHDRFR